MKLRWHLWAAVPGAFLLLLFLTQQREMNDHLGRLKDQHRQTEARLHATEEELAVLKGEAHMHHRSLAQIQESLTKTAGVLTDLQKAEQARMTDLEKTMARRVDDLKNELARDSQTYRTIQQEVDSLRQSVTRDPDALSKGILYPSVKVTYQSSVGGGTILYSRPSSTYLLTAYHVVHKAVEAKEREEIRRPVEIQTYVPEGKFSDTFAARIVAYDEKKDLALLRLDHQQPFPYTARLLPKTHAQRIRIFTPLYAVGCPLGHDPIPTPGEVTNLNKQVGGERFFMMNAPTIFGNSGGGIFHRDTHELLGISAMVCTYDNLLSTPVPHLGIFISMDTIYDWLDSESMQFLYDPAVTAEACDELREQRGKDKPDPIRVTWETK